MAHITTQSEWETSMCERILSLVHDELYLDFRFLDTALSALVYCGKEELKVTATDGIGLYYSREQLLRVYRNNPVFIDRAYLHSVLHCVFSHLWMRGKRNVLLWNLASDIAVEWVIDAAEKKSVRRILSRTRTEYYRHLQEEEIPVTAAAIYTDLLRITDPDKQWKLQTEFYVDDHRFWPGDENPSPAVRQARRDWEKTGRTTRREMEKRGMEASDQGEKILTQIRVGRRSGSYRDFLRKFMVLREEPICDEDAFDLAYYTYGLRLYKNMPLIEPLETREILKVLNFVIVIDTSYSTSGTLVQRFLRETFQMISSGDSFFHRSKIHVIQCDAQVRTDTLIESAEDIERLKENFTLCGGGGTDFRPAFAYIQAQLEAGVYEHLKGVLYFTDGKGIYPSRPPGFDTAFVFTGDHNREDVPAWAMKIKLEPEDLL